MNRNALADRLVTYADTVVAFAPVVIVGVYGATRDLTCEAEG